MSSKLDRETKVANPPADPAPESHPLLFQDELTGLYNRRFFNRTWAEEMLRAAQTGEPLGLLLIDVDFFKSINDRYGHHSGDLLLQQVGELLKDAVGDDGLPVRYAGDEFVVILPGRTARETIEVADRLVQATRARKYQLEDRTVDVTFSVGVGHCPGDVQDPHLLFDAADRATYIAKKGGRNQAAQYRAQDRQELDPTQLHNYFPCEKFIAREPMVLELLGCLISSPGGERPWAVISGHSGIGKTRLMQEFARRLDEQRSFLLEAVGLPHLASQPFAMLLPAISVALRRSAHGISKVSAALSIEELEAAADLLPEFKRYTKSDSGAQRRDQIDQQTSALVKMIRALAEGRVPVLIVDDIQWADAHTASVLSALRGDRNSFACLAVGTAGESGMHKNVRKLISQLRDELSTLELELRPLSLDEVRQMVEAIVPGAQNAPKLASFILNRSKGRPLLVEEALKLLLQRGTLHWSGGKLLVEDLEAAGVPTDDRALVESRAEMADDEVREVMSHAAVIGPWFDPAVLLAIEERGEGYLGKVLERARKLSIIAEEWTGTQFRYVFVSGQVHNAFAQMLERDERARIEKKIREARERLKAGPSEEVDDLIDLGAVVDRVIAIDALRGLALLGMLVAATWQSTWVTVYWTWGFGHPADVCFGWLLLGIGVGAPLAYSALWTKPGPMRTYTDKVLWPAVILIVLGVALDRFTGGKLPLGGGTLQIVGCAWLGAAVLASEPPLTRLAVASGLLIAQGVLIKYDQFRWIIKATSAWHLDWLPSLLPGVAIAILGTFAGIAMTFERRSVSGIIATALVAAAAGVGLSVRWNSTAYVAGPSLVLVQVGTGLLLLLLFHVVGSVIPIVLRPLAMLGMKPVAGLSALVCVEALFMWKNPGPYVRMVAPILAALIWMWVVKRATADDV